MMNRALNIANYVMIAAFALSVLVQYNDPDPLRWMALYGAAAVACVLYATGRARWWFAAAVGVIALAWAIPLAPAVIGKTAFGEMFEAWEMKNERVEVSREMYGLLIVAAWMAVLTFAHWRRGAKPSG
jgi:drug/metabolite transporter (DMT)-like permease